MWDNLSYYNVSTERKALEIIFDYLQLDMLTKPECTVKIGSKYRVPKICFDKWLEGGENDGE